MTVWSEWQPLERNYVRGLPQLPGVFQVSCQATSCIVYIGRAAGREGLRQGLRQRVNNPTRYLSEYEKHLCEQDCRLMFRYAEATSEAQAIDLKATEIAEFRQHHGHLPPGNKVAPRQSRA